MTQSVTGNAGPRVRSDIEVTLEITGSGGHELKIKSKVKSMYGKAIETQCRDLLSNLRRQNARLSVNDTGALPFVIAARVEAAVRALTGTTTSFLPEMIAENNYPSSRTDFAFQDCTSPATIRACSLMQASIHLTV